MYIVQIYSSTTVCIHVVMVHEITNIIIDDGDDYQPLTTWVRNEVNVAYKHKNNKYYKGMLVHIDMARGCSVSKNAME